MPGKPTIKTFRAMSLSVCDERDGVYAMYPTNQDMSG